MIKSISMGNLNSSFCANPEEKIQDETRILPNTSETRLRQGYQKTSSAFLDYPAKGLRGDINSNFYEFLTMGIVPYLAGSAMFMIVFNCINKLLNENSKKYSTLGKRMALGVVLYGILKNITKGLVTKPIKWATGVDVEMPYQNKVYNLPKEAGENANIDIQYQQRKVFDSKEFYRKDLLNKEYFDNVARKLGLGTDLNDSVSETSPIIQNIIATSNTAKSLATYSWAAVGVGLAAQTPWVDMFEAFSNRTKGKGIKNFGKNIWETSRNFGNAFIKSCKSLWTGENSRSFLGKHSGKGLIGLAVLLTSVLTANSIIRAKNMAKNKNKNTIDETKESTVI